MLSVAERRSGAEIEHGALRFERMDAEELTLEDASFDAVVSLCAVLHFPRIDRALAEMRRVLRPGGVAVVSFGSGRPGTPLMLARHAARRAGSRVHDRLRPELRAPSLLVQLANAELPEAEGDGLTSWAGDNPLRRLVELVEAAGFQQVRSSWSGHEVRFASSAELWDAQLAIVTEVRKRVLGSDPASVERLRDRFDAEAIRVLSENGRLVYPYGATFVRAVAPRS